VTYLPRRTLGLLLGGLILALLFAAIAYAVSRLAQAAISPSILLWIAVPIGCVPLALPVGYRIFSLTTARYVLDRNHFSLTWGLASETVPLTRMAAPRPAEDVVPGLRPEPGLWWPGCIVGHRKVEGLGNVEFFATQTGAGLVLLTVGDRHLAISPADREGFLRAFTDALRSGALERIGEASQRPDFLFDRIWADRWARAILLGGLILPLLLLAFLAIQAPGLPDAVPFGFDPAGAPGPAAPPGRLLLLPLIGGLCWLADLALGAWVYRREGDRLLAYGLWAGAILVGGLLWGATLQLLAAA
jgi:hypothetical protein